MKIFSSKKRAAAIGAVTAATLLTGTVAFAYWTAAGTGQGTATTAVGDSSLEISGNAAAAMYPGDSPQALVVTVRNAATNSAYVSGLKAKVTVLKTGVDCDGSDFKINGSPAGSLVGLNWSAVDIASGASISTAATAGPTYNTIQFNNKSDKNQDQCKGLKVADLQIDYVAS